MKRFVKNLSKTDVLLCLLLTVTALLCHGRYLLTPGLLFATEGDSFRQILPNTVLYQNMLAAGDPFWSWSFGLGGDVFTELSYAGTTSPFTYLQFLLRSLLGGIDADLLAALHWKLGFSVLRQALSMVLFYALLRYEKQRPAYALVGALVYGCAPWFLYRAIVFDFMTDVYPVLPLVALAFARFRETGKWGFLSVSVALLIGTNFYFGYIGCLFFATVFVILSFEKGAGGPAFLRRILALIGVCALGAALSAPALLPSVNAILSSDRTVANAQLVLLPHADTIKGLFEQLFLGSGKLGLPLLILLAPFLKKGSLSGAGKKRTALALLWLILLLIPATASIMNGFSYETPRWHFVVIFAVAWAVPYWLSALEDGCSARTWLPWALCGVLSGLYVVLGNLTVSVAGAAWLLSFGLSLCGLLLVYYGPRIRSGRLGRYWAAALAATVLLSGVLNSVSVRVRDLSATNLTDSFFGGDGVKAANQDLSVENGVFYRVHDRTTDTCDEDGENRPYVYGTHGISNYASELNGNLSRWHRRTSAFPSTPVCAHIYQSFDDRLFQDIAWGVRYKIDPSNRAASLPGNWQPMKTASGADAYESSLSTGFDLWYDTALTEHAWRQLSTAERDAALLQTAAIPGEQAAFRYDAPALDPVTEALETVFADAVIVGGAWSGEVLSVPEEAVLTFDLPHMGREGEWLLTANIAEISGVDRFSIGFNGRTLEKFADSLASESLNYPLTDYAFRFSGKDSALSLTLSRGEYRLTNLLISFNGYEKLADWVAARNQYNLTDLSVAGSHITGVIENETAGILALSMPYSKGWICRVDGAKTPLLTVNGIFTGIELAPGNHTVELTYRPPYLLAGLCVSLTGAIALLAVTLVKRRRAVRAQ